MANQTHTTNIENKQSSLADRIARTRMRIIDLECKPFGCHVAEQISAARAELNSLRAQLDKAA